MGLKYDLQQVLDDVKTKMSEIYGDDLDKIILYGSYARGDYRDESDIDIMVLVKCSEEEVKKSRSKWIRASSELGIDYDIYVSIKVINLDYFNRWKNSMPLFVNVAKEGSRVYG